MSTLPMTAVVLLNVEPAWLALSRVERGAHAARVGEILARHPQVEVSWFDADALGHGYTDFAVCRFSELAAYHFLWEELRDTPIFSTPYMRLTQVILGIERGYEAYEKHVAAAR